MFQEPAVEVLLFQHQELGPSHFAAIHLELGVELAAGFDEVGFAEGGSGGGDHLVFERGEDLFQRFELGVVGFEVG